MEITVECGTTAPVAPRLPIGIGVFLSQVSGHRVGRGGVARHLAVMFVQTQFCFCVEMDLKG